MKFSKRVAIISLTNWEFPIDIEMDIGKVIAVKCEKTDGAIKIINSEIQ